MIRVLLVDDETLARSYMVNIVEWEKEGFELVGSAANGKAALALLENQPVDVVFTDIKMPIMDGIELVKQLEALSAPPLRVILSAYDEFALVREAFRHGAFDYILKSNLNPKGLLEMLRSIRKHLGGNRGIRAQASPSPASVQLKSIANGDMAEASTLLEGTWRLACFEIDHFERESLRFGGNLETALVQPMLNYAQQVPRVANRCVLTNVWVSRFLLLIKGEDATGQAKSICEQVQRLWKHYMNISVTVGISEVSAAPDAFPMRYHQCDQLASLRYIFGFGGIYTTSESDLFDVRAARARESYFQPLLHNLQSMKAEQLILAQRDLLTEIARLNLQEAKVLALQLVYILQLHLAHIGVDLWQVFNNEYGADFYQCIQSLESAHAVELWITGVLRWITEYLDQHEASSQTGPIDKAKRFIADNSTNPELNLAAVADHVGLNSKYFSSRFAKEVGRSFIQYMIDLRISKAKQLILKTDMKIYEVSEACGFSSVEHFTRVFKKHTGNSPKSYQGDGKVEKE